MIESKNNDSNIDVLAAIPEQVDDISDQTLIISSENNDSSASSNTVFSSLTEVMKNKVDNDSDDEGGGDNTGSAHEITCNNSSNSTKEDVIIAEPLDMLAQVITIADEAVYTPERLFQVLSNVVANNKWPIADDQDNSNSVFDQLLWPHGDARQGVTPTDAVTTSATIASLAMGIFIVLYQKNHQKQLNSYEYLQEALGKTNVTAPETKEIQNMVDDLLKREKIRLPTQNETAIKHKQFEPNFVVQIFQKLLASKLIRFVSHVFQTTNLSFYTYWVVFFTVVLIAGVAFAATSLGLTIIFSITGAIFLTFLVMQLTNLFLNRNKSSLKNELEKINDSQIINRLKTRVLLKELHKKRMDALSKYMSTEPEKEQNEKKETLSAESNQPLSVDRDNSRFIRLKLKTNAQPILEDQSTTTTKEVITDTDIDKILNSKLGYRLLGGRPEHFIDVMTRIILTVSSAIAIGSFLLWVPASFATLIGATTVASFLFFPPVALTVCSFLFVVFFAKYLVEAHTEHLAFKKKIYDTLTAPYEKETNQQGKSVTKLQKFEDLMKEAKNLKEEVIKLRQELANRHIQVEPNLSQLCDQCQINEVFNDYLFEKQKLKPSIFTLCKKGISRIHTFIAGAGSLGYLFRQIGIVSGCLILAGTTGLFVGGPIGFAVMVGAFLIIGGVAKVIQYQVNRDKEHRKKFIDGFDDRISALKKHNKELTSIREVLSSRLNKKQNSNVCAKLNNAHPVNENTPTCSNENVNHTINHIDTTKLATDAFFSHPNQSHQSHECKLDVDDAQLNQLYVEKNQLQNLVCH